MKLTDHVVVFSLKERAQLRQAGALLDRAVALFTKHKLGDDDDSVEAWAAAHSIATLVSASDRMVDFVKAERGLL